MTMHKSLRARNALQRQRSVLKRDERLEKLKEKGRWEEGESVLGLPKTKVQVAKIVKKKKKKEEEADAVEGAEAADETPSGD